MPLTIPPFSQYQAPLVPLRGVWNTPPPEGDKFVNIEVDWLVNTSNLTAVQFALAGNSPVALSQIAALAIDNSRSGADVVFLFPDSGFSLSIPSHEGGVFPVFTNALMFYAIAANAQSGDVTVFQVMNSIPPPVPVSPTFAQNHAGISAASIVNGSTPIVAAPISGTLNTISLSIAATATSAGSFNVAFVDGNSRTVWEGVFSVAAGGVPQEFPVNLTGLSIRFANGLAMVISGEVNITGGAIYGNVYYSTP
jgi:hypothetical protein